MLAAAFKICPKPTEQQLEEYSGAVRKTAKVFSSMQVKAGTVAERDKLAADLQELGGEVLMAIALRTGLIFL